VFDGILEGAAFLSESLTQIRENIAWDVTSHVVVYMKAIASMEANVSLGRMDHQACLLK